jgi:hypothetical protein
VFPAHHLPAFFATLRTGGFAVGPIEQQRIIDLLFELEVGGRMPHESDRLSNMLACVVCTSAEQQIQFRRHFVACFGAWHDRNLLAPARAPAEGPVKVFETQEAARNSSRRKFLSASQWQIMFRFGIAIAALIGVLELVLAWPYQTWSSLAAPDLLATGPRSAWNAIRNTAGPALLFVALPIFSVIALWITAPGRVSTAYLNRRLVDYRPEFIRLMVETSPFNPYFDRNLHRRVQELRRARLVESREIDIEGTLNATLSYAGFFTPVFAPCRIAPEYLVLIDRRDANDHLLHYALSLVVALRKAQVYVDVYYYNADIRRLMASVGAPALTFEEVVSRHPEHRLILIGTGDRLFDAATGNLQPWAHLVQKFSRRVLLTPVPRETWGYRERTLQTSLQTMVLSVSPRAISIMVDVLVAEEPPTPKPPARQMGPRAEAMADLATLLDDRAMLWIETGTPDKKSLVLLDRALHAALPQETYNLLTACAIYPELNWNLTVHVGVALFQRSLSMADHLLSLCNLPWFRTGRMPNWLRARLTAGMPNDLYEKLRVLLNALLLTSLGFARKTMAIEAGLNKPDIVAAEQRLSSRMRDPILIDFMTRLRRERTAVELPRILVGMMPSGRWWLRNIFSHSHLDDLCVNAKTMHEFVEGGGIEAARITRGRENQRTEIRPVFELMDSSGPAIATVNTCFLYVPVGKSPARLIDDKSVALYLLRRKTMMQMSIVNVISVLLTAVLLFAGQFQNINAGIGVVIVMVWIAGPFWLLHWLLVRPVWKRFELFPGFRSWLAGPPHLSTRFVREDRTGHVRFAEESVSGSMSDPEKLGRIVKHIFLTKKGKIARLKDGTALLVSGNEIRRFDSLADCQEACGDRAQWIKLKTKESKQDFYREAAVCLEQINGDPPG